LSAGRFGTSIGDPQTLSGLPSFFSLHRLNAVASTNDEARARAERGEPEGTLIWAREQLSGRGRRGRTWHSPPGNLYCSILLRPSCPANMAAQISFLTAVSLAEAIRCKVPSSLAVTHKWPNDILIDGRKIAGILLESHLTAEATVEWLVVGTGVNVMHYPADIDRAATSLHEVGADVACDELLRTYAHRFAGWLERWRADGFEPVRAAWLDAAFGIGEPITVRLPEETLEGVFQGLDDDGALRLGLSDGARRIAAGEVYFGGDGTGSRND
jgi:BirA family biotin operon repressor/biotin-[acetyl-CoA-carboxylase] ligase